MNKQTTLKNNQSKVICILGFIIPIVSIHIWHNNEDKFPTALNLAILFAFIYLVCFVIGIFKKKKYLIASFPVYIISFILLFQLLNFQTDRNEHNAEELIKSLEKYKVKTGKYPDSLAELQPQFQSSIPKVWFGLFSRDYDYSLNKENRSFALSIQFGAKSYKMWESSMGVWQILD